MLVTKSMKKTGEVIRGIWYRFWGGIAAVILYDSKVRKSKEFHGSHLGLKKRGWKWAVWDFWGRVFLGANRGVRFPVSFGNTVINPQSVAFDYDDLEIFRGRGKFFQANGGKIVIGKGTWIANNTGIITANHDRNDLNRMADGHDVIIGKNCWIGMNCVLLPGTVLGDNTTVGAGAIVNGKFPEGNCLLVGAPAYKKKDYILENKDGL